MKKGPGRIVLGRTMSRHLYNFLLVIGVVFTPIVMAHGAPRTSTPAAPKFDEPNGADLNVGKSPAQVFSSDCGICHKSSQGLVKDRSTGALTSFLRQHYTTGAPQAAILADYLRSIASDPRNARPSARGAPAHPADSASETRRRPAREEDENSPARERKTSPLHDANRPPEPVPPAGKRRPPKPEEASRPEDAKPKPTARNPRAPKQEETRKQEGMKKPEGDAKPAEASSSPADLASPSESQAQKPQQPSASAVSPPAEEKPAAPPPPQIPL